MTCPIRRILTESKTVAIVGLSTKPEQESYGVACYLADHGFDIIPVNPGADEILGRKSYANLRDLSEPPDVVDVFRRPDAMPEIVEDAIAIGAKAVWMQLGITHADAARRAREAGLTVVMDHCMKREHQKLSKKSTAKGEEAPEDACQWRPPMAAEES